MQRASSGGNDAFPEYGEFAETELVLIRHAETAWNRERRIQGQIDVGLSLMGHEQARRLADRLAREPIRAVYSSDLSRARETAEPLAAALGVPLATTPLLREVSFGAWEGRTAAEVEAGWPEEYAAWRRDSVSCRPPEGEPLEELQVRALAAAAGIVAAHPRERIAIVGHGGSIKAILCGLIGLPLSIWRRLRVDNASISRLVFAPPGPTLTLYNDVLHLE